MKPGELEARETRRALRASGADCQHEYQFNNVSAIGRVDSGYDVNITYQCRLCGHLHRFLDVTCRDVVALARYTQFDVVYPLESLKDLKAEVGQSMTGSKAHMHRCPGCGLEYSEAEA